ncbi:podocalyxin isoform X2 [Ahaetulla prasina]|uniref:podocalyxin isoform X2 n=1 Tax=Ahaetulla prasina TaxID=499056 RepID=UPI002647B8AC|nr:podocalyxin isoform X2 [Ahaetulla prasina]
MLRGDPPPAMRWALRWRLVLLLAGLLGSPPCGGGISGVTADSSPPPPTTLTLRSVAGVSPSSVASGIVTTSTLTPPLGAPSSKPAALPTSSTSPVVVKSSKMPAVGTSVKTTTPSLPTKRGDTTTAAAPAVIAATTAASRAPTLAPVLATTHTTSSRGIAAKDLTSVSGPTTVTLSPSSPASIRPVGSTAKSPGPPLISAKPSAVAGVVIGPTTLATVATTKTAPTSKDKFSAALLTSPNTLVTTAMPKPSASPKSSTVHSSSSVSSTRPELKTAPPSLSSGTTTPQVSHVPSPSSRTNLSSVQGQTKIVCENNMPPKEKAIVLTLNASQPCNSLEGSPLKEALMEVLCKALKPNYNQNRDDCTIWLASDTEDLRRVAVVKTSVQTHFVDEELSEALAAKKAELEKFGVNNITYGGRPLDTEPKDHLSLPLIITIICMAASLLLVAAIYGCCHQRISQRKDQRLTEELHTIENGYHDNPTLEVMETLSEMQEKKVNLNGELGDSWIVPMDSLTKDELDEEEDTHL